MNADELRPGNVTLEADQVAAVAVVVDLGRLLAAAVDEVCGARPSIDPRRGCPRALCALYHELSAKYPAAGPPS